MTALKTLKSGKLYIKFINHKLTFQVVPYDKNKDYNENLLHNSKLGYRQAPIIDIRLIALMKLILKNGYRVANIKGQQTKVASNLIIKNSNLNNLIKALNIANDKDKIDINLISFLKGNNKIVIRNNGMISATKNVYPELVTKITAFLDSTESC